MPDRLPEIANLIIILVLNMLTVELCRFCLGKVGIVIDVNRRWEPVIRIFFVLLTEMK